MVEGEGVEMDGYETRRITHFERLGYHKLMGL